MASEVKFFEPQSVLGTLADWELQTGANPSISRQRAQALKSDGDELAAVQYGEQTAYSENYVAKKWTGDFVTPKVGTVSASGAHIDSFTVGYSQTGYPTLEVAAHKHGNTAHDVCRTYSPSVKLPARAIGVPSSLFKAAGNVKVFELPDGVGMRSLQYAFTVNHTDEMDGEGNHLAGENNDGVETITIELTGKIQTTDLAIDSDWMIESDSDSEGNTQATTKSITLTHHVAHDTGNS